MKKILKHIILLFLLATAGHLKSFSNEIRYDTSKVEVKLPSEDNLNDFRTKSDFDYTTEVVPSESIGVIPSESILDRIIDWFLRTIDSLFSNEGFAPLIRWAIIAGLVVFIVLLLMNVKIQSLFYRNRKQDSLFIASEEMNLSKTDIDELIKNEIQNKNYRLAVRYLYLKLLKILNDKEIIYMQMSKTNDDYKKEMRSTKFNEEFTGLSKVFEFVFYGNFSVEQALFEKINMDFKSIFAKLDE